MILHLLHSLPALGQAWDAYSHPENHRERARLLLHSLPFCTFESHEGEEGRVYSVSFPSFAGDEEKMVNPSNNAAPTSYPADTHSENSTDSLSEGIFEEKNAQVHARNSDISDALLDTSSKALGATILACAGAYVLGGKKLKGLSALALSALYVPITAANGLKKREGLAQNLSVCASFALVGAHYLRRAQRPAREQ